ncbi:MAG TPA: hypothetical protein PLL26_02555 [Candidatus Dojkabacteria bacterium]|nr:hypothetical protein [Candidatus Dojkabacteria bacterium]
MQKSPVTDRDVGLMVGRSNEVKFSDIRHKALKEYINIKKKRKKTKQFQFQKHILENKL